MFIKTPAIESMKGAYDVNGKNVVITGGNRGIGFGIASAFSESGANVCIICRNTNSGAYAVEKLNSNGGRNTCIECDVSDYNQVKAASNKIFDFFDHVDVLVNNAGVATTTPFLSPDGLKEWHRVIGADLHGPAYMIYEIAPKMIEAGLGGEIINISSMGAVRMSDAKDHHNPPYSVAKAGIDVFTQYLALVLGDYGIRVNSIRPGPFHSDLDKDLPQSVLDGIEKNMPCHRFGMPIELGALAVFLASPAGRQITGVNYSADGGFGLIF